MTGAWMAELLVVRSLTNTRVERDLRDTTLELSHSRIVDMLLDVERDPEFAAMACHGSVAHLPNQLEERGARGVTVRSTADTIEVRAVDRSTVS